MSGSWRWDPCISHRGSDVKDFFTSYFNVESNVLLVCGAGFDPRATFICEQLHAKIVNMDCLLVREERPNPINDLVALADTNCKKMKKIIPNSKVQQIQIFASDGAVIGGRSIITSINKITLHDYSDIIVDVSALSTGIAFPLVKYLCGLSPNNELNLHVVAVDAPQIDQSIVAESSDRAEFITGFKGSVSLDERSEAIKLWLPQLVRGKKSIFERLRTTINPHEVCPILPFPSANPRLADELLEEYAEEFENVWNVDMRSIVYADEKNPMDLYRSILRIADAHKRVFESVGGSEVILSPAGSKALSMGVLMAAIERDFPVMHIESVSYRMSEEFTISDGQIVDENLLHVWLCGIVY